MPEPRHEPGDLPARIDIFINNAGLSPVQTAIFKGILIDVQATEHAAGARDFVAWLGETYRSVSYPASMAVQYHPSNPSGQADLLTAYKEARDA